MSLNINTICNRYYPVVLLIFLAGVVAYSNSFQIPFVFDDARSITQNDVIRSLENFYANSTGYEYLPNRYIGYLTFALNYHFGKLNPAGYHAVNLFVHLITALLMYSLLRLTFSTPYFRQKGYVSNPQPSVLSPQSSALSTQHSALTPDCFIPLCGALLFVIHPIQTQAVSYIVQRVTLLATMFYLLSMVLYVKGRLLTQNGERKNCPHSSRQNIKAWLFIAGSSIASILAMKTKEIAFTLPLAITIYEIYFFQGTWKQKILYLLPLLATLPIIPLTIIGFGGSGGEIVYAPGTEELRVGTAMSRLDYLFTQFRVIVTYLRLLILPVNQNLDYDYPVYSNFFTPPVFLSFLLLISIFFLGIYLFWVSRSKSHSQSESQSESEFIPQPLPQPAHSPLLRLLSYSIIWFFLTLTVESSLVPIRDVIMEHRLYLPFFGAASTLAIILSYAVAKLTGPSSGKLLLLCAAILILIFGFATYKRNYIWGDTIRLWQDVISKSPAKARPINNLGKALEAAGRRPEALDAFSRAITVDPTYYKAYYNLADLYLVSEQPNKSLSLLQTAIRLNPNFWEAYISAGAALMRSGRFRDVISFLEQNLHIVKDHPEAHFYLGASYAFLGNREKALRELEIVSRGDPALAANLAGMLGLRSNRGGGHGKR